MGGYFHIVEMLVITIEQQVVVGVLLMMFSQRVAGGLFEGLSRNAITRQHDHFFQTFHDMLSCKR